MRASLAVPFIFENSPPPSQIVQFDCGTDSVTGTEHAAADHKLLSAALIGVARARGQWQ